MFRCWVIRVKTARRQIYNKSGVFTQNNDRTKTARYTGRIARLLKVFVHTLKTVQQQSVSNSPRCPPVYIPSSRCDTPKC